MGWTAIPTTLLFMQEELDISPLGLNILMNLVVHWWEREETPFPSQSALAYRMGVSQRSVQREIAKLCKQGLIAKSSSPVRHPQFKGRNTYDLTPLADLVNAKAPDLIASMEQRRKRKSNVSEEG
jgi:DNA-binding MarR family transcriptional regulator